MYKITRALGTYDKLTPAQRTSGLFAEEPVVAGKVLRRNAGPLILNDESYKLFSAKIKQLEKAGAIKVEFLEPKDKVIKALQEPKLDEPVVVVETPELVPEILQEKEDSKKKPKSSNKKG
jgi:hypothetical protein